MFLDDDLVPWGDQWAHLASVHKIGRAHVERIVQEAERHGRILGVRLPPQDDGEDEPWTAPPSRRRKESPVVGELPKTLEVVLAKVSARVITKSPHASGSLLVAESFCT